MSPVSPSDEPCHGLPKWRIGLRLLLFTGIAGFMLFSPASRHFLPKQEYIPYTRGWKYFRDYGKGICHVEYEMSRAGEMVPLDRYAALGFDTPEKAPRWLRRIRHGPTAKGRDVVWVTRTLCRALGPDADALYVRARCADRDGWYDVYYGKEPVCKTLTRPPPAPRADDEEQEEEL